MIFMNDIYISKSVARASILHEDPYLVYAIDRVPAANVREVVTCQECMHRMDPNRQNCTGRRPDWFCADGKRRSDIYE